MSNNYGSTDKKNKTPNSISKISSINKSSTNKVNNLYIHTKMNTISPIFTKNKLMPLEENSRCNTEYEKKTLNSERTPIIKKR